jgi:hypothetical protein
LWRIVLAWAVALAPVLFFYGPAYGGVMTMVGLVPGFAGRVVGHRRMADLAGLCLLGLVLLAAFAVPIGDTLALAGGLVLIVCAMLEAHRTGGRAFVLALYGWCAFSLAPTLPGSADGAPFIAAGLIWGAVAARWIGLEGVAVLPAASARTTVSLGLFLLVGVVIAGQLTDMVDRTYGYWVVLLFVMRALSPPEHSAVQALRYGVGAVVGSGCAFVLAISVPPGPLLVLLALGVAVVGLRYLPHPGPWSAAAFTSAVVMILPIGMSGILLRVEAALLAVALTLALIAFIGLGWRLVGWTKGPSAPERASRSP